MLKDAHEDDRLEEPFDNVIVVTRLSELVLLSDYFAGDFISPLEILGKDIRVRANVARGLGKWGTDVDRKTHLASKHETIRREASRL